MTAPEIRWIENDIKVEQLRKRMSVLRDEFNIKNQGKVLENYDDKLDGFINRKVKKEMNEIMKEQFSIINSSL